jgi:hypothetical protein
MVYQKFSQKQEDPRRFSDGIESQAPQKEDGAPESGRGKKVYE